jgi:hypothetical protein
MRTTDGARGCDKVAGRQSGLVASGVLPQNKVAKGKNQYLFCRPKGSNFNQTRAGDFDAQSYALPRARRGGDRFWANSRKVPSRKFEYLFGKYTIWRT